MKENSQNKLKRSFFYVETQYENLGDALLNKELIELIEDFSDEVFIGVAKAPDSFLAKLGIKNLLNINFDYQSGRSVFLIKIFLSLLAGKRCWLFLSPGGWIGELDGNLNLRSWLHSFLYVMLHMAGVKICQVGVSYEDLGPKLRRLLKFRSRFMSYHYVRDDQSKELARNFGIIVDGICPDLSLNSFSTNLINSNNGITFSFRFDQYQKQSEEIKSIVKLVIDNFRVDQPIYFVSQVERDTAPMQQLVAWVNSEFGLNCELDDACHSIASANQYYRRSNIIFSNRLHALLIAASAGNSMIACPIGNHNKKIKALFTDFGLQRFLLTTEATKSDVLKLTHESTHAFDPLEKKSKIHQIFLKIYA